MTEREERRMVRSIRTLRKEEGNFTSKRLSIVCGVEKKLTTRGFQNYMHKHRFRYLRARKKGLLTGRDLGKRMKFCRRVKKYKLGEKFWTKGVSIYLDGKGFAWKQNPRDQARAPKARVWRKRNEGLEFGCTAKAGKAGVTNLNFIVGMSYDKGVILCSRYHGPITGAKFARIIIKDLKPALEKSINPKGKLVLQDNCPRQQSKIARNALDSIGAKQIKIPARSPDINCIENLFAQVSRLLERQAIDMDITSESKEEFEERIKTTLTNFPVDKINKLIESMPTRIDMILKIKGRRLKY